MTDQQAAIGKRIATARERRGWKQNELARRAGVPIPTFNRIEKGQQSLLAERLGAIAQALGVSADSLLGLTGEPAEAAGEPAPPPGPRRPRGRPRKHPLAATAAAVQP